MPTGASNLGTTVVLTAAGRWGNGDRVAHFPLSGERRCQVRCSREGMSVICGSRGSMCERWVGASQRREGKVRPQ